MGRYSCQCGTGVRRALQCYYDLNTLCGTVCVRGPSDGLLFVSLCSLPLRQRLDMLEFLPLFCVWHWPIRKHLSFIRSLPYTFSRRSVNQAVALLFAATPCWDRTRSKQLSTVSILVNDFQFGLYHVVVPLNFISSNRPCFTVMLLWSKFSWIFSQMPFTVSIVMKVNTRLRLEL